MSSSSSSDEGAKEGDPLVRAALALEREKLEALRLKEMDRRARAEAKADAKRRRRETGGEEDAGPSDREQLAAWQAEERRKEWAHISAAMVDAPPAPDLAISAQDEMLVDEKPPLIPLSFFARNPALAWETAAPGGRGIRYAPLIGVTPGAEGSSDEW